MRKKEARRKFRRASSASELAERVSQLFHQ
jgi:hypothetical protein